MKKCVFVGLIGILCACDRSPTCEEYADNYRPDTAQIVVTDRSISGRIIKLKGYDPRTGKAVDFYKMDSYFIRLSDILRVGDTLIKKVGETDYVVHQPNINVALHLDLNCDSPVSLDTLRK